MKRFLIKYYRINQQFVYNFFFKFIKVMEKEIFKYVNLCEWKVRRGDQNIWMLERRWVGGNFLVELRKFNFKLEVEGVVNYLIDVVKF